MIDIKDTIEAMTSDNYQMRFAAEYWQTKIRYEKLKAMLTKWEACTEKYSSSYTEDFNRELEHALGFRPTCPFSMLRDQQKHMGEYLHSLELRAALEQIDLGEYLFYKKAL